MVTARRDHLLNKLKEYCLVKLDRSDLQLASGELTDTYVDVRVGISHSGVLWQVITKLYDLIDGNLLKPDLIGGMATGAIPLVYGLLHRYATFGQCMRAFYVRDNPKDHGLH